MAINEALSFQTVQPRFTMVLFSLFAGSLLGSVIGLVILVVGKPVWSAKLPFGPYLAFGAVTWMFFGEIFLRWYAGLLTP